MTYARSILIPRGSPGTFHCVSRCVRRAFLCGEDRLTGRSFEHRRQWVEDCIHELADIFGVAIWGYAVMSNHLHVVVQTLPEVVSRWSNNEVAERWMRLYPRQDQNAEMRAEVLVGNAERVMVLRERLSNLSWFMRCLLEPIARAANKEDICKGRFWEGRFKAQSLLDDNAVLAAMAYVDLNPVRAKICDSLEASMHTSARERLTEIEQEPAAADRPLSAIAGIRGLSVLRMSQAEYLSLVDCTGRQIRADKRCAIEGPAARGAGALGLSPGDLDASGIGGEIGLQPSDGRGREPRQGSRDGAVLLARNRYGTLAGRGVAAAVNATSSVQIGGIVGAGQTRMKHCG